MQPQRKTKGDLFFPPFFPRDPFYFFVFSAFEPGKITTIGIIDGGNEIGMAKVHQQAIEHVQNGRNIASTVATASVSNWGGSALVAALRVLNQCPAAVHLRYARCVAGTDGISISKEDVLITVETVMVLVKPLIPS